MAGYANDIVSLLTNLGVNYNPSNPNISIANLKSKIEELNSINSQLVNAENEYSIAVSEREEIYKGENGINNRIILIKTYLASLEEGKNSAEYKAFALALK